MKALTLTQPWATLIAIGAKSIETRSWKTNYRGLLAIHDAVGGYTDDVWFAKVEPFYSCLRRAGIESRQQIPLGGIVAICYLADIKPTGEVHITQQERAFGDYTPGRFAWFLDDVTRLTPPIGVKGKQGLWDWN